MLLSAGSRAHAEQRPSLAVDVQGCEAVDPAELRRIVALELGANVVSQDALPPHVTQVRAACDQAAVQIEVRDPLTAKSVTRAIAFERVQVRARTRVLAIAIAELVSASWFELAFERRAREREPESEPARPKPAEVERRAALRVVNALAPSWRLGLGFGPALRIARRDPNLAFGGALQLAAQSPAGPVLLVDLSAWYARSSFALGSASTTALTLGCAGLLSTTRGALSARVGVGVRGGYAQFTGRSADRSTARDGSIAGPWFGPMLVGATLLGTGSAGALSLGGELGWTLATVHGRVDGVRALGFDGLWAGVALTWLASL